MGATALLAGVCLSWARRQSSLADPSLPDGSNRLADLFRSLASAVAALFQPRDDAPLLLAEGVTPHQETVVEGFVPTEEVEVQEGLVGPGAGRVIKPGGRLSEEELQRRIAAMKGEGPRRSAVQVGRCRVQGCGSSQAGVGAEGAWLQRCCGSCGRFFTSPRERAEGATQAWAAAAAGCLGGSYGSGAPNLVQLGCSYGWMVYLKSCCGLPLRCPMCLVGVVGVQSTSCPALLCPACRGRRPALWLTGSLAPTPSWSPSMVSTLLAEKLLQGVVHHNHLVLLVHNARLMILALP